MKLHLGCGPRYIPGFTHVDAQAAPHVDIVGPAERLSIEDGSVSLIYASHILEHYARNEYEDVLREWFRVLEPGGILRLSVPNFAACAEIYYENGLSDGLSGLVGLIIGGQRDEYDYHKMIFDEAFLSQVLTQIGFNEVRLWDWQTTEHANIDDFSQAYIPHMDKENGKLMSLNIEAVK